MFRKFKISMICIVLSVFSGSSMAKAQLFQDTVALNLVKKNIDCVYNHQFKTAFEIYLKIKELYPEHPVVYLLHGLSTYWKNYPMSDRSPDYISFEEDLRQCIRLSEKNNKPANKAEYLLANLCARGMLIKFYDDNAHTVKVIPLVMSLYKYMRISTKYTGECTDLFYYTGAYNYYHEAYPEIHPVYKPVAFLLPSGNKERGLRELNNVAANAVVLRAEAYSMLASIYLNFENNYELSGNYSKKLHEIYPDNMLYFSFYVKNLLLLKQYDEAEKLIRVILKRTENRYFLAQQDIFQGIVQEKKYHDYKMAQQYYKSGISRITPFGEYGNEYMAYAYFGLSRISFTNNDKVTGNKYRQKAMKLGDFKKINFDR